MDNYAICIPYKYATSCPTSEAHCWAKAKRNSSGALLRAKSPPLIKCGPKPGRGTVEPPKRYQKPHGNNRDALQRPKRYPRATQGLPKGCTRDQHRGNTVPVRCIQDTRKRMGMGRVACCVAAILIMAKTLGEQAVSAPSSH